MRLRAVPPLFLALPLALLAACSGDPTSGARPDEARDSDASTNGGPGETRDAGPGNPGTVEPVAFACPAGITFDQGLNTVTFEGKERTYFVDLPKNTATPPGVLFSWHGFGDTASNHRNALELAPDADPAVPVIVITPEDTGLQPLDGLGWDIKTGKPGEPNVDIPFFDALLGCAETQAKVDPARVYALGFSAGSVMTSLLSSRHPKLFAAIIAASGIWMNDPDEVKLIKLSIPWSWPELSPADGGNVLLMHGGPTDSIQVSGFELANLEATAQVALEFLKTNKRTVVDCAHTKGHTLHPEVSSTQLVTYLTAHKLGGTAPFQNGLTGMPASCTLRTP